jgi:nicotinamide mononucleotide transporter
MLQIFFQWVESNWVELLGAILGLLYILLSIRQNKWCWPIGLLTSVLYIYVFLVTKFYADMLLQVYYVGASIFGWYNWTYGGKNGRKVLPVRWVKLREWAWIAAVTTALFIIMAYVLKYHTDSPIPYWDAFTTAGSFVATWMLAKKMIENWLFWIVVDAVSLGLYIYKGLYATVVLFVVYTFLAIIGYMQWRNELKNGAAQKPQEAWA